MLSFLAAAIAPRSPSSVLIGYTYNLRTWEVMRTGDSGREREEGVEM